MSYVNHNMKLITSRLYKRRFSDPLEKYIWYIPANRVESSIEAALYL